MTELEHDESANLKLGLALFVLFLLLLGLTFVVGIGVVYLAVF
jgi:hypothetical protein